MRASQFETLERDLADALSQVKPAELSQRRGFVDMVLEEYDNLENVEKVNLNPVRYLNKQLSEHTYLDLSLFNLIIAEILTNKIKLNNEESNLDLVNSGISAINNWRIYRDKHELANKRRIRENAARRSENTQAARDVRATRHRELWKQIRKLYKPTIAELHREGVSITYNNIARRIAPLVESLNKVGKKNYLLGGKDDPVGAIKDRLEKGKREGEIDSTVEYRKKKPDL